MIMKIAHNKLATKQFIDTHNFLDCENSHEGNQIMKYAFNILQWSVLVSTTSVQAAEDYILKMSNTTLFKDLVVIPIIWQ